MAVDAQQGGTFRESGWLELTKIARDSTELRFSFQQGALATPSSLDLQILKRAREELSDPTRWVSTDHHNTS